MRSERLSLGRVCGLVLLSIIFVSVVFRSGPSAAEPNAIDERNSDVKKKEGSSRSIATVPRDDDFQLAFRESLGFFDDIPAHEWQRMKAITKGRVYHSIEIGKLTKPENAAPRYYAANWDPDFSCQFEVSIGQALADGHKWVCDPHRLANKEDCLVYSIGSNGNFAFEEDLQRHLPNCEIHVFDPTDYSQQMQKNGLNSSNYHAWGLKSTYGEPVAVNKQLEGLDFVSLPDSMAQLGHTGRRIDIFKIDCEGCEWSTQKDFLDQNIQQILVEVHSVGQVTAQFFDDLHNEGYAIFHKEANLYTGGRCMEFAFLKLAKEYFE